MVEVCICYLKMRKKVNNKKNNIYENNQLLKLKTLTPNHFTRQGIFLFN